MAIRNNALSVNDFEVGDTAYLVCIYCDRYGKQMDIRECEVTKVGSKYVYVSRTRFSYETKFYRPEGTRNNYLVSTGYGSATKLFKTEEDADDFIRTDELRSKLQQKFRRIAFSRFSLSQLKKIEAILEEVENDDN